MAVLERRTCNARVEISSTERERFKHSLANLKFVCLVERRSGLTPHPKTGHIRQLAEVYSGASEPEGFPA